VLQVSVITIKRGGAGGTEHSVEINLLLTVVYCMIIIAEGTI
jgi:hypothetical protein